MKKFLALLLAGLMTMSLAACGSSSSGSSAASSAPAASGSASSAAASTADPAADVKVGLICVHDIQSGYDAAHIEGLTEACKELGIDEIGRAHV